MQSLIFIPILFSIFAYAMEKAILENDITQQTNSNHTNQFVLTRTALRDKKKLWPNATVPYIISGNFTAEQKKIIADTIAVFHNKTCVKFCHRTSAQKDYVDFVSGSKCESKVGREGGRQEISLKHFCFKVTMLLHELMHTIGFIHEHSRPDRDKHINITWENIKGGGKKNINFDKESWNKFQNLSEEYDMESIMHYGHSYFAINPKIKTLTPINKSKFIRPSHSFSPADLRKINKLYQCKTKM